jgi:integrase
VRDWHAAGMGAKTLQNQISRLRQICRWLDKPGLIPSRDGMAYFLPEVDPASLKVSKIATESKSWSEHGLNVVEKIREADALDIRFGAMLRLGVGFGLRRKEQLQLVLSRADAGTWLLLRDNVAKSGKDRDVPIFHPIQRAFLDHAKKVAGRGRPLGWPVRTFAQNENRYAYLMRKLGITRLDADCVGHGLRAEFAENLALYQGLVPATLGGGSDQMPEQKREAIQRNVSEALGHHRIDVTHAYYGSFRTKSS